EETLSRSAPTTVEEVHNHIIICNYSSRGETIIDEFESRDVEYVVIEPDEDEALELDDEGISVIHGNPESTKALEKAHASNASAMIVDSTDEKNASIILSAREVNPDLRIISLVADSSLANYLEYAGADEVLTPRRLLGKSIADRATTGVKTELGDMLEIGEEFNIAEFPVHFDSDICDKRIAQSGVREKTGAHIIGVWKGNEFIGSPPSDTMIDESTVLLVAGSEQQLEDLKGMTLTEGRRYPEQRDKVIIAGEGMVGSTVYEYLHDAENVEITVVDVEEKGDVDILGDVTDEDVLREAGVEDATALIIALADDTDSIFTTLVAHELNPDMEIIVRANETESLGKLYRAGADYVLALPNVSGRMLALDVLGEDVMSLNKQVKIVRTSAPRLEGKSLADAKVGERTGCVVVAVERDGELFTELSAEFEILENDKMIVAGSDEDINEFEAEFVD
ncbi:MAG: NAD-binding protein, partial [Halobacteria archaeon]|nr:NAD-binding protein [Halobacteria archaeon]